MNLAPKFETEPTFHRSTMGTISSLVRYVVLSDSTRFVKENITIFVTREAIGRYLIAVLPYSRSKLNQLMLYIKPC